MAWYPRENYLKKIRDFYHETDIIKVITGVRRCGKSCLMETIANELKSSGIPSNHIYSSTWTVRTIIKLQIRNN